MPTKKIGDVPEGFESSFPSAPRPCRDSEHNPPSMRVFEPGVYEHTCPRCKAMQIFTVQKPMLIRQPHFTSRRYR